MPNNSIRNVQMQVLSDNWYVLRKVTYEHNREKKTVILTRQFRMPTYINGNETGMLIEACAGLLDRDNPEDAIRRETEEETGYRVTGVRKIFEAYMSPGSVTEILYFFVAEYSKEMKQSDGGGVDSEDIEVLEYNFQQALNMIDTGEIKDGKTIMLLQYALIHNLLSL